jgi:fatty-acyl-CoA synthase
MKAFRIASLADVELIESLPYERFMAHASIHAAMDDAATRHPERSALTFIEAAEDPTKTRRWTHREFMADVRRAANLFQSLAGAHEPRVAMLLPAIPQAYFTLWGAEAAGVVCPINYLLDGEHIAELIRASEANILVALGPNADLDIWSRVPGLRVRCPGLRHVLAVGGHLNTDDASDFDSALARHPGERLQRTPETRADALVALFHTGGTTGAPKLAQHSHGNQLHSGWSAAQMYAMTEHDVIVNGFPMFHVAGSIVYGLSSLLSGAEIVLPTLLGMRNPAFAARYWEFVERHRVTLLAAVPTVISTLLALDPKASDLTSVRALLTGGSPLPPELAVAFERRYGIPVRNILGMTECAGVVSIEPALADRVPGSCGLRLPFTRVEAISVQGSEAGAVCPPGHPGILRLRGPNVGAGYTDARRNAGALSAEGWLSTGDIGHVDERGLVYVTGRAKDLIIRSGHNIEPGMIEEALMRHPQVQFAAAVGEPDEYAGEMPVAFVVLKSGATVSAAALLEFVKPHIAERPALPRRIDIVPHLPLTAVGKVYKPGLRLTAIERVITERLERGGLSAQVSVEGRDSASGLSVTFALAPGTEWDAVDAPVREIMSRFAVSWAWTT